MYLAVHADRRGEHERADPRRVPAGRHPLRDPAAVPVHHLRQEDRALDPLTRAPALGVLVEVRVRQAEPGQQLLGRRAPGSVVRGDPLEEQLLLPEETFALGAEAEPDSPALGERRLGERRETPRSQARDRCNRRELRDPFVEGAGGEPRSLPSRVAHGDVIEPQRRRPKLAGAVDLQRDQRPEPQRMLGVARLQR